MIIEVIIFLTFRFLLVSQQTLEVTSMNEEKNGKIYKTWIQQYRKFVHTSICKFNILYRLHFIRFSEYTIAGPLKWLFRYIRSKYMVLVSICWSKQYHFHNVFTNKIVFVYGNRTMVSVSIKYTNVLLNCQKTELLKGFRRQELLSPLFDIRSRCK